MLGVGLNVGDTMLPSRIARPEDHREKGSAMKKGGWMVKRRAPRLGFRV